MSIRVERLSRSFGLQKAVDGISFSVVSGEITGFLGPNGAGKSTTMKMITGFLPPDEGKIEVRELDVVQNPLGVKRLIGYLPEHNPLYLDMYVHEYLNFMAGLQGMTSGKRPVRIREITGMCGLRDEQNKKLGALSKGYRQRVGLAQALIHDPPVLILDEPTSGLDPNQLIEIRNLIREVSVEKTVLFSSHILQEVEAICDRVIVINHGQLVADDKLDNLRGRSTAVIVEFGSGVDRGELLAIPNVEHVQAEGANKFRITAVPGTDIRGALVAWATGRNISVLELRQTENSLEAIFGQLTQTPATTA